MVIPSHGIDICSRLHPSTPPVSVPQISRTASSRYVYFCETILDAYCVQDKVGFTVRWLFAFHWVRVRVREICCVVTNYEKEIETH